MASRLFGLRLRLVTLVAAACAFVAGAMLTAQSAEPSERETFAVPTANGLPVDACLTGIGDCGPLAAYEFCRSQGYERETGWSTGPAARTWMPRVGAICETGPGRQCRSLRNVTCSRPPAPAGSRTFAVPIFNDAPVDRCRNSGSDCGGKTAADLFCQTQDFAQASSWTTAVYKQTWNIGSREHCRQSAERRCEGLANVVCSGGLASRLKGPVGTSALPRLGSQLNPTGPGRIEDAPGLSAASAGPGFTSWTGEALEQRRQTLSPEQYGRLFADIAMAIAPYSRIARLSEGLELPGLPKGSEPNWDAYYRIGLAGGPASARAVGAHLSRLDKLLLTGDRTALARALIAIFNK